MLRRTEILRNESRAAQTKKDREKQADTNVLALGSLVIDLAKRSVTNNGQSVELKPKEFDLLAFLAAHPGQVFSREVLLDRVWGYDYVGSTRTVDVHISWLRAKLERDAASPKLLQTMHGVGYRLSAPAKD
jgi:DNA-binding response OmpR family regulator